MYMNNSLVVSGVDASGATPRTPEILNSLISMTNPFEILKSQRAVSSPHSDSNSSSCSPPSVQHTCSQLIKEGLKHTLQSKRRNNSETSSIETKKEIEEINSNSALGEASSDGLTPEDEERRRRRRERNKIAATKCRLKKREKTVNLVQESEHLETQNHELKYQIQELEKQKRDLFDMLSSHEQVCAKTSTTYDQSSSTSPFIDQYQRSDRFAYTAAFHNSSVDSSYHWNDRFCRSSTVAVTYNYDENVNATSVLMNNFRVSESTDDFSHADSAVYANLNVRTPNYLNRGSPTRICRPSSISINTSGSEYESNTELVDSPSLPPTNFHTFEEESRTYTEGYARGSCIS